MDSKEKALRRAVSILRGGLQPSPYKGVTCILVSTRLVDEVVQQAADSIAGGKPEQVVPKPYIRIKGA